MRQRVLLPFSVVTGTALSALVPMVVVPAMPRMAEHFGAGADGVLLAQLTLSIPGLMIVVGGLSAAALSRHLGQRQSLLMLLLLFSISGLSGLFIQNIWVFFLARLSTGFAAGAASALCIALIADHYEGRAREKALGFTAAAGSVLGMTALALGGWLVDAAGWRTPFILYGIGLLVLLTAAVSVKDRRTSGQVTARGPNILAVLKPILALYTLLMTLGIGMFLMNTQGSFLLARAGIHSATQQGSILAATAFVAIFSSASYGFLRKILTSRSILMLTAASLGIGLILASIFNEVLTLTLSCIIVGIGAGLTTPVLKSLVLARTPAGARAVTAGLLMTAIFFGQFLTPVVAEPLRRSFGVQGAFMTLGIVFVLIGASLRFARLQLDEK
jgi:MFS family permease